MERRTHEGPMDFEYQNGTGPMDGRSPFAQISLNAQRQQPNNDRKRSFATFGCASKASSIPSLREPASQPHFFVPSTLSSSSASASVLSSSSSPHKPLPTLPHKNNPLFSTPRKLDDDFASSGGETPKSPEHRDIDFDSDATPDTMGFRSKSSTLDTMTRPVFTAGGKPAPVAEHRERRQSWWRGVIRSSPLGNSNSNSNSNSSGPRAKGDEYSHAAERKILKNRRRKQNLALQRRDSASDSDADADGSHAGKALRKATTNNNNKLASSDPSNDPQLDKPHWLYTFFGFLTAHPTLPHILSFYAQLLLNLFLIVSIMYIAYSFWATIRADVDKKSTEAIADLLAEMAVCAQQYTANRCDRATRVPAMEVVCTNWEKCMNQDPRNVGRARVSAHTFAEIFNSFIEPISYKAMIFSLILVFGSVGISNFAFSIFRDKAAAAHAASQNHHHYYSNNMPPPPPTPQRHFGGPDAAAAAAAYYTPYQQGQGMRLEPARSAFPDRQIEGSAAQQSPVRKLQFR